MTRAKLKALVIALVALSLITLNTVVFTQTTTVMCPEEGAYTIENKSRGFPLTYWSESDTNFPPCEFSSLSASTAFGLQAMLVNLITAGGILMGAHLLLDYKRGKK